MTKSNVKGYIFIILSAVIFGSMPLMANYIYADGVNPLSLVLLRNLLSLIPLSLIAIIRKKSFKVAPRDLPAIATVGIFGCALTPFLLFSSYQFMDTGAATVFHFVYPAAVLLFGLIFLRARFRWGNLACLILCVGGIVMFYTPGAAVNLAGSAIALSSGITYAIYIVLLGAFGNRGLDGFVFSFYVTLFATVILFIVCLATGGLVLPRTLLGWALCLFFAVIVNVGAVVLFQHGTFIIGPERAAILSTFEPITSVAAGFFFLGESVGYLALIGSALVILAGVLIAVLDMKNKGEERN